MYVFEGTFGMRKLYIRLNCYEWGEEKKIKLKKILKIKTLAKTLDFVARQRDTLFYKIKMSLKIYKQLT
jgi:hypothetical protein